MADTEKKTARVRLQRLVDDLGGTLLEVIEGAQALEAEVTGVTIFDPRDELVIWPGELVLGVGLNSEVEIIDLIRKLGAARAAALVIKTPTHIGTAVRDSACAHDVSLLGLNGTASWFQVAVLLQTLLDRWTVIEGRHFGDSPVGDLFAFANAVSALVDAPVTVEDRASRVLAFSGRQDEADAGRVETILGRQMPKGLRQILEERGVFRDLYSSHEPIHVPATGPGMLPRVAVAVRAGSEVLGALWVVAREPLPEHRLRALADAAELAALHMLRQRNTMDFDRQLSAELLGSVLAGGVGAAEAASRLGLRDGPLCVLAGQPLCAPGAEFESAGQRLADALALHLAAIRVRSAVAIVGRFVYAVISVDARKAYEDVLRHMQSITSDFVSRLGTRDRVVIGIGGLAPSLPGLGKARTEAERTVRVLRAGTKAAVACFEEVYLETVLDQLSDVLAGEADHARGPIARLMTYDTSNGTDLTVSVRAYLEAFGDVKAAAAAVNVHPNTFRYRLKRIREVSGIDLKDSRTRLAVLMQLTASSNLSA